MTNNDWIKTYINLMLHDNPEEAIPLKNTHFPKSFYKYRPLNEHTLQALENNVLWISEIGKLNDPFECALLLDNNDIWRVLFKEESFRSRFKIRFNCEISNEEIAKIVLDSEPFIAYYNLCKEKGIILRTSPEQQLDRIYSLWKEDKSKLLLNIMRICSFSECFDSLLMWSHYSDEHRGLCIEYDFINCDFTAFLQPVYYSNEIPRINSINDVTAVKQIMASIYKSTDWIYEREWRLTFFSEDQNKDGKNQVIVPKPKAIYLGARFDLNNQENLIRFEQIVKTKNIQVYQIKMHESEFKLIGIPRLL